MEMGFDGKTAWSDSPLTGPTIHSDVPKQVTDAANFSPIPLQGVRIDYGGQRRIGRRTFDVVKGTTPDGQTLTSYFDVETGLQAGMDTGEVPPSPDRMALSFDGYKRFGAILSPTKTTTVMQGQELVVRTVSVSYGPFEDKLFELPPAVRQLRDKSPQR